MLKNSGVGYETAKELIKRGCNVIITCRSEKKAKQTKDNIKTQLESECKTMKNIKFGKISHLILDLSNKKSIDDAILNFYSMNLNINILVCNAGAWLENIYITKDEIEVSWQTNYFGHFYFTKKLLKHIINSSKLKQLGRIINVSSIMHKYANIEYID